MNKHRTNSYNKVFDLIYEQTNELGDIGAQEKGADCSAPRFCTLSRGRTGTDCSIGV